MTEEETAQLPVSQQEVQIQAPSFLEKIADRVKNQKLGILIGMLAVLVLAGLGFCGYKLLVIYQAGQPRCLIPEGCPPKKEFVLPTTIPTPLPSEVLTKEGDLTANWKTYVGTKARYSFKYPQEWQPVNVPLAPECMVCVEDINFLPVGFRYNPNSADSTLAVILVFKEDRIKSLDDYINIHIKGDPSIIDIKNITLGGEKAVSYRLSSGIMPLPVIEYAVVKKNLYYTVRLEDSLETNKNKAENVKIFNLMLSTFKFLPSADSTGSGQRE